MHGIETSLRKESYETYLDLEGNTVQTSSVAHVLLPNVCGEESFRFAVIILGSV